MKTIKKYPSKECLLQMFEYRNGELFWKIRKASFLSIGDFAGRADKKGYFRICIDGKEFRRSRLVYIMHKGDIPNGLLIDHKNEIKYDDRIENLRLATNSQNKINTKLRADNTSGVKGVKWKVLNKKWEVAIFVNGRNMYLGLYDNIEEAKKVYIRAAKKYHKEFAKF